jgi:tellurium resistance protein TerZ
VTYEAREEGAHEIQVLVDGRPFGNYTSHVKKSNIDPFNMRKGDDIPITAAKISVGLGWSNSGKSEIDLDASCMMFRYTTKLDHCYFKDTRSLCGSVTHSGDKRSGSGATRDDETIRVNLDKVPGKYTTLLFTVNIWDQDKTFSEMTNAYVRLIDDAHGAELCRYSLNHFGAHTGLIICSVSYRDACLPPSRYLTDSRSCANNH